MTSFDPRTVHAMTAQQFGTPRPDAAQFQSGQFASGQFRTQGFAGQQYTGPVPPPPSQPTRKPRPMAAKIIAGLVAAGLVVGGAGTWMALSGSSAEAAVQTTSFAGANPTTSPFGTDAPQVAAVAATGPQTGDTTGLYAATTPPRCNNADYLAQLQSDPAKLAAFGGVFGIGAGDVPAFVDSLSPVVLRANTAVTDHPYTDGAFTEQPAILAAGTAVLVNRYGEPTVKCFNGNPLTAGAQAADAVTVVPTTQVIARYSFTTIDNSRVVVIPGKPDTKPIPGPNPTTTPQPDPELVKKAEETKAARRAGPHRGHRRPPEGRHRHRCRHQGAGRPRRCPGRPEPGHQGRQPRGHRRADEGARRGQGRRGHQGEPGQVRRVRCPERRGHRRPGREERQGRPGQGRRLRQDPRRDQGRQGRHGAEQEREGRRPRAKADPARTVTGQEGQAPAQHLDPVRRRRRRRHHGLHGPRRLRRHRDRHDDDGRRVHLDRHLVEGHRLRRSSSSSSSSTSSTGGSQSGSKEGSDK